MFTNIKTTVAIAAVLGILTHAEQQFETADQVAENKPEESEASCTVGDDQETCMNPDKEVDPIELESLANIVSPSGYQFDPTDQKECREAFVKIEQMYLDVVDQYSNDPAELSKLYDDIFDAINKSVPRLNVTQN